MSFNYIPLTDRLHAMSGCFKRDRLPFAAAMAVGLCSHGYAFANKLVNHDEIESLFGKGATVTSGRWGLELVKILFPDWSMPWIYGIISLLLMSAAVCVMLRVINVRFRLFQGLLAALVISFPSLTGNFCFMFTSTAYAWAFLLAVLSVYLFMHRGAGYKIASAVSLVLALGIYQAYIAVAASLYVLVMIADTLDGFKPVKKIILFGIRALAIMAVSIGLYYGITQAVFAVSGAEFNAYVTENVNSEAGLIRKIRMAYDSFWYVFSFRNFYLISTEASRYVHIAFAALSVLSAGALAFRQKKPLYAGLLAVLVFILPLSICCMYLIMSPQSIHTMVLFSFVAVYFFAAVVFERLIGVPGNLVRDASALIMAFIIFSNVYFANMVYLKLQLQYESAYSFYTSLAAQIKDTEGFDESSVLAIVGRQDNLLYDYPTLDTNLLNSVNHDLVNIYSVENFFRYYLGFAVPFADEEETELLQADERVAQMAEYPYYGSVAKIDSFIVVKFG